MKVATKSEKAGIEKFVEKEVAAMIKEYRQIYNGNMEGNPVVTPIDTDTLSYKDNSNSIEAVDLIKEKRSCIIKASTCDDGSKQKYYLTGG